MAREESKGTMRHLFTTVHALTSRYRSSIVNASSARAALVSTHERSPCEFVAIQRIFHRIIHGCQLNTNDQLLSVKTSRPQLLEKDGGRWFKEMTRRVTPYYSMRSKTKTTGLGLFMADRFISANPNARKHPGIRDLFLAY